MNRIASLVLIIASLLYLISGCGTKKTKEQIFAEAERYKQQENYKEAIKTYDELIKTYPHINTADSILFIIGQIYSNNLNDFESAISVHKRIVKEYPNSKIRAQALFMIGYHYANNVNNMEKAREYYEQFLEKYPNHELSSSVKWELEHLGQDINEIDFLKAESTQNQQQETAPSPTQKTE